MTSGADRTIAVSSLRELKQAVERWRPDAEPDACFRLEFVPAGSARLKWERELAAWYGDCGCAGGVAGALALTIGYILAAYAFRWFPAPVGGFALIALIGAFMAGSIIGKLVGLGHARLRVSATVRQIERAQEMQRGG